MSAYKEFSGKTVEEALKAARDEFGAELNDLDFEILTAWQPWRAGHGRRAGPDRGGAPGASVVPRRSVTRPHPSHCRRPRRAVRDRPPRRDDRPGSTATAVPGVTTGAAVHLAATTAHAGTTDRR